MQSVDEQKATQLSYMFTCWEVQMDGSIYIFSWSKYLKDEKVCKINLLVKTLL